MSRLCLLEPAALIEGNTRRDHEGPYAAVGRIPWRPGVEEFVRDARHLHYRVAVVGTSAAARALASALDADLIAPDEEGIPCSHCRSTHCLSAVVGMERDNGAEQVVSVVADDRAICLLRASDIGVALADASAEVRLAADVCVRDLRAVPSIMRQRDAIAPIVAPSDTSPAFAA